MKEFISSEFLTLISTHIISCKQKSDNTEKLGDSLLVVLIKKGKKTTRGELIVVKMNYWTIQNAVILEQYKTEKMTEEVQTMEDIKKNYAKAIQELSFSQFSTLIKIVQVVESNYRG